MTKYQKKPVIVEANQWNGRRSELPLGARITEDGRVYVETMHMDGNAKAGEVAYQRVYLEPGDWILPEPDGVHYYPVKPEVFDNTYEPVAQLEPEESHD